MKILVQVLDHVATEGLVAISDKIIDISSGCELY